MAFLVALVGALFACAAPLAAVPVPFNATIVGKRFFWRDDCPTTNRFALYAYVNATARTIRYLPPYCRRCDYLFKTLRCQPRIELHLSRRTAHPHITRRRFVEFNKTTHPHASCEKDQGVETSWPWGESRERFIDAFRTIANGTILIRDQAADPKCSQKPGLSGARFIVNYLLALSWDFYFSI